MAAPLDNPSHSLLSSGIETPFGPPEIIPVQVFLDSVLPPLQPGLDPKQILKSLKNNQTSSQKIITGRNRWRGFAKDPKQSEESVYYTFKHLEGVSKAIIKAVSADHGDAKPIRHLEANPNYVMRHLRRGFERFPDASFLDGPELSWKTVAVCGEYEKVEGARSVQDVTTKINDSMAKCMNDPRRRFVFGYTINNTDTRLWFCDRSRCVISEPFNFVTDHLSWIHFCLSTIYAEPHQLGWDTTMTLLPDGANYDILVRSAEGQTRTYRTVYDLEYRRTFPDDQLRKGTTLWKAMRVDNGEETEVEFVVLKDVWVHPDRVREGDVIQRIRQDALEAGLDEARVEQYIQKVEYHGDVFIGDDNPTLDCTRTLPTDGPTDDSTSEISTNRRVHYRLVLSTAGDKSIEKEESFGVICHTLARVGESLQMLHELGWVHRNINIGNIIVDAEDGPPLVDFEYAVRISDEDNSGILQVSRFFKAVEVDRQAFLFGPPPETPVGADEPGDPIQAGKSQEPGVRFDANSPRRQTEADESPQEPEGDLLPPQARPAAPAAVPFRYIPLHDLESLWWVALYFLLKRRCVPNDDLPLPSPGERRWVLEDQVKCAEEVFYGAETRGLIMQNADYFCGKVVPLVHPAMQCVGRNLDYSRGLLVQSYEDVEKNSASTGLADGEDLHGYFTEWFELLADRERKNILLTTFDSRPPPSVSSSRAASQPPTQPCLDEMALREREETKGSKAKQRRKSATVVHHYSLRPRPGKQNLLFDPFNV